MARMSLAYPRRMQARLSEAAALYHTVAVQEETDGDGQVWTASALAGLELTNDEIRRHFRLNATRHRRGPAGH